MNKQSGRKNVPRRTPSSPLRSGGVGSNKSGKSLVKPLMVGIGTSAGGLEALEQFLRKVPVDGDVGYIVVQHLDPTHKGMLPELLARFTPMEVFQAKNGLQVRSGCVYVIPPNKDLSIQQGVLKLFDPNPMRGLRLPVDFLFRSLADDQGDNSVGVILSGMGSDGALGIRAIKEKGGLVLVQDPADAKFDGMPRSAIATGLADIVAAASALPAKIVAYHEHPRIDDSAALDQSSPGYNGLDRVIAMLRARTGRDFSQYKKSSVLRRIARRIGIHQLEGIPAYLSYVKKSPAELDLLFKELLIGVTGFFRDPAAWQVVQDNALPKLLASRPKGGSLRAWVAGCSTGEEAYSLAIAFMEAFKQAPHRARYALQIFATDLDRDAIDLARRGVYSAAIASNMEPELLKRYFIEEDNGFRVRTEIRETVTFAAHDVLLDPPFTKLDFLSCRNLLIYLDTEPQQRLIEVFQYSLNPGGFLFLGAAETTGRDGTYFNPLDRKMRLYRCQGIPIKAASINFPQGEHALAPRYDEHMKALNSVDNLQTLAEHLLLQRFAPAAVLINVRGDILYVSGRTGKYLELPAGKVNWNIYALAKEELRGPITTALSQVIRNKSEVIVRGVTVETSGGPQTLDLYVQTIERKAPSADLLIVAFTDVEAPSYKSSVNIRVKGNRSNYAKELELALRHTNEDAANLREDMQSAKEELRSANEELQSTNEELTTSKEEMQSMNEELQTVNAELQSKVDDLMRASSDMRNLLDSTDIATVFLNAKLQVRRFTANANQVFRLISADVGRPLSDIVTDLDYRGLGSDAQEVLRTLIFSEKLISTEDGRRFKVRIMPYRTLDNVVDGVVITCVNITEYLSMLKEEP